MSGLLRVDGGGTAVDHIIDQAPELINRIGSMVGKGKKKEEKPTPSGERRNRSGARINHASASRLHIYESGRCWK